MTIAYDIDQLINHILVKAENQHELLIGACQSEVKLTNTQEHILMLLAEESLTNTELAKQLKVSQAAVTKAVKALVSQGLLDAVKDKIDGRLTYFRLTDAGLPIAKEHRHHHRHTLAVYEEVLAGFHADEQVTIGRFVKALSQALDSY